MAWYAKSTGSYSRDSAAAIANAKEIANVLSGSCGWTINAVCGLLGNMAAESGYNPWRWESDSILASTDTSLIATSTTHGYGLVQFTPAGKYINNASSYAGYGPNFSNKIGKATDGQAQMLYINDHADYYATSSYPLSYAQYKASTESADYLAAAWLYNYERPADPSATINARQSNALYWAGVLDGYIPVPSGRASWWFGGIRDVLRRLIIHA